jgi:hypothetical protein
MRVSTYVITSWDLPDVVRPNDRDLLHDVLPYARDIREEEHGEEACYTTEAGQGHSPVSLHQRISRFSNPSMPVFLYVGVMSVGGDVTYSLLALLRVHPRRLVCTVYLVSSALSSPSPKSIQFPPFLRYGNCRLTSGHKDSCTSNSWVGPWAA